MKPLISFIVPVYNGELYLRQCINSLLAQEGVVVEVIAVDDGSSDESLQVLQSYGEAIKTIRTPNRGVSIARNVGFGESSGQNVVFIDQDDQVLPRYGLAMSSELAANPEAGAVYCDTQVQVSEGRQAGESWTIVSGDFTGRMFAGFLLGKCFVSPGAVMLRRSTFESIGGFDPTLNNRGEDLDLWLKIARFFPWSYVPQPLFTWRKHGENQSNKIIAMYLGIRHILERHMTLNRPEFLSDGDIARAYRHSRKGAAAYLRQGLKADIRSGMPKGEAIRQILKELRQAPELTVDFLRVPLLRR